MTTLAVMHLMHCLWSSWMGMQYLKTISFGLRRGGGEKGEKQRILRVRETFAFYPFECPILPELSPCK